MRLVFDIETDGLLRACTKLHCIVAIDADTGAVHRFDNKQLEAGLRLLSEAEQLIGHNIINFDIPALEKLYPHWKYQGEVHDTLVYTRLLWGNIGTSDAGRVAAFKRTAGKTGIPPKMAGRQSLESWGYRLKVHKSDFGKTTDWSEFSPEMLDYCEQDVVVNVALWHRILKELETYNPTTALQLEHQAAWLLAKQERNGFKFDVAAGIELYGQLAAKRGEIKDRLITQFGSWYVANGLTYPKRTLNYKDKHKADLTDGAPYTKIKLVEFNPGSRQHIAKVLGEMGWKPTEFTESGQAKVDETILESIAEKFPEAKLLAEYFMLQKRIGQLSEGNNGWLQLVSNDGFIHGSINPNGAVTGRATHMEPNVAQVPSSRAMYGRECRTLFTVPAGMVLVGSDASGLELRCLGHYMAAYDGGNYNHVILEGDIHTENQKKAGLPTRDAAKEFIYSFLYGAGDELIGQQVGYSDEDRNRWRKANAHIRVIALLKAREMPVTVDRVAHILKGGEVKKKFLKGLPALGKVIDAVQSEASENGYIIGLDGRRIHIRYAHAALNSQLQSAGALICKKWIVELDRLLREKYNLKHGRDGDYFFCAWVHDEVQIASKPEHADLIGNACQEAMTNTEQFFQFLCPLATAYNVGASWAETH